MGRHHEIRRLHDFHQGAAQASLSARAARRTASAAAQLLQGLRPELREAIQRPFPADRRPLLRRRDRLPAREVHHADAGQGMVGRPAQVLPPPLQPRRHRVRRDPRARQRVCLDAGRRDRLHADHDAALLVRHQ